MNLKLSLPFEQVLENARKTAFEAGSPEVKPEHLLYSIAVHQNNCAVPMLKRMALQISSLAEALTKYLGIVSRAPASPEEIIHLNEESAMIIVHALHMARNSNERYVSTGHILLSILAAENQPEIFKMLGIIGKHEENPLVVETGSAEKQTALVS